MVMENQMPAIAAWKHFTEGSAEIHPNLIRSGTTITPNPQTENQNSQNAGQAQRTASEFLPTWFLGGGGGGGGGGPPPQSPQNLKLRLPRAGNAPLPSPWSTKAWDTATEAL
jgi:hypothetical protein